MFLEADTPRKRIRSGLDIIINEFGRVGALTAQDGTPWFNAVDVCRVLGYKNVTDILKKHVDEADLSKREARSGGQIREMNFVNESGLYSLVFGSKMPNAKAFKRWVRHAHPAGE